MPSRLPRRRARSTQRISSLYRKTLKVQHVVAGSSRRSSAPAGTRASTTAAHRRGRLAVLRNCARPGVRLGSRNLALAKLIWVNVPVVEAPRSPRPCAWASDERRKPRDRYDCSGEADPAQIPSAVARNPRVTASGFRWLHRGAAGHLPRAFISRSWIYWRSPSQAGKFWTTGNVGVYEQSAEERR